MNLQEGNVGNLGDVAKHLAWVALARLVVERAGDGPLVAIDSHAFRLRAPRARSASRGIDAPEGVAALLAVGPSRALDAYLALEAEVAPDYLCSPGLALRVLPHERTAFRFAERDPATRAALVEATAVALPEGGLPEGAQRTADVRVAPDASELETVVDVRGAVVALFDPFRIGSEDTPLFHALGRALAKARAPGAPGVLLAYRHDGLGGGFLSLEAEGWQPEPVAFWSGGKHRLAVYATRGLEDAAHAAVAVAGFAAP